MHVLLVGDEDFQSAFRTEILARNTQATITTARTVDEAQQNPFGTAEKPLEAAIVDAHTPPNSATPRDPATVTTAELIRALSEADVWTVVVSEHDDSLDGLPDEDKGTMQHSSSDEPQDIVEQLFVDRRYWGLRWYEPVEGPDPNAGF